MKLTYISALFFAVSLAACGGSSEQQEESNNEPQSTHTETAAAPAAPTIDSAQHKQIEAYVKKNNLKGEFTPEGIFISTKEEGKGGSPTVNNEITIDYAGYLLDGKPFDASKPGSPVTFPLSQLIQGWQIAIPKMKKGGSAKIIIPSEKGYGSQDSERIPANSILVFDIKLYDFK